jgi:hypothetical protein
MGYEVPDRHATLVDLSSLLGRRRLRIEEGARTEALSRGAPAQ